MSKKVPLASESENSDSPVLNPEECNREKITD
jgi:hypothetical protein